MSKAIIETDDNLPVRRDYTFSRPLIEAEAGMLVECIVWRKGSAVTRNTDGEVVGCTAHPDDLGEFLAQQRRQNLRGDDRLKATHQPRQQCNT